MSTAQQSKDKLDLGTHPADEPSVCATERNRYPLQCGMCGVTRYVDESRYRKVLAVLRWDPSDTPFFCEECESDFADPEFLRDR